MIFDLNKAKEITERIPYSIGRPISLIPFSFRPGIGCLYSKRASQIKSFEECAIDDKKDFIFNRIKSVAVFAKKNISFYNEFYREKGFDPEDLRSFDDIKFIPIINKDILQQVPLNERSVLKKNSALVNTGGSSGKPLEFYIQSNSVAHEWSHLHHAWKHINFSYSDLKIMFVGRSSVRNVVDYDAGRHSLVVDIYKNFGLISSFLKKALKKYNPKFMHGYPSAIFDFMTWVSDNDDYLFNYFKSNIKGIILSSEFPAPQQRHYIERLYGIRTLSFYGHTERCVLATENEMKYNFFPYQTYGYSEAVGMYDGFHLVGTSYYNFSSPLIRYDTGDLIEPSYDKDLLSSFKIKSGREGEFIFDKFGRKLYLTAFVFGRHHKAFEIASHIQLCQNKSSSLVSILLTLRDSRCSVVDANDLLDLNNVDLDFEVRVGDQPVKTKIGKVPLLVNCFDYSKFHLL